MASMVQKECKACGCPIEVRLADHKRGWGNFCDKSCAAAYKVGKRPGKIINTDLKYHRYKFNQRKEDR